jgi:hypothetical protein
MKGDNTLLSTYIDSPCTVGRGGTRDEVSRINGWNQSLYFFYEGDQFTIFFFFFFFTGNFFFFSESGGPRGWNSATGSISLTLTLEVDGRSLVESNATFSHHLLHSFSYGST